MEGREGVGGVDVARNQLEMHVGHGLAGDGPGTGPQVPTVGPQVPVQSVGGARDRGAEGPALGRAELTDPAGVPAR